MQLQGGSLREQILTLVTQFHAAEFPPAPFVPGQSRVPFAGRVFDHEELVRLVDAALDLWPTTGRYAESFEQRSATRLLFAGNLCRQPAYQSVKYRVVNELLQSDFVMRHVFWIGVYPGLTPAVVDYMIEQLHEAGRKLTAQRVGAA